MSARLVSAVMDSTLPAWLKPYAIAFATFAADDGTQVYPTVARVARMVSRTPRATQAAIQELRRRQILEVAIGPAHARAVRYVFHVQALPGAPLPLFDGPPPDAQNGAPVNTDRRFPQAGPGIGAEISRFPQACTGVNTKWASRKGEAHFTRSVKDPSGQVLVQRAREARAARPGKRGNG